MRRRLSGIALTPLLLVGAGSTPPRHHAHPRTALARHDGVVVRRTPSLTGRVLARLPQQTQVQVTGHRHMWDRVTVWAGVQGWVRQGDLIFRHPSELSSTYTAPTTRIPIRPIPARSVSASAVADADVTLAAGPDRRGVSTLRAGHRVHVSAWQQDGLGHIWYRVGTLWSDASALRFITPDPGAATVAGHPAWWTVRGKGMWLTLGAITNNDPAAVVQAAVHSHITHLYVEAAISPLGFHGRDSVGPLLHAAHVHHLAVLAWVYPYLDNPGADVLLTQTVAGYRSMQGDTFDGIAADLERHMTVGGIRPYAQLVRATLGVHYLLVGVTYPPQSISTYPFAEVGRQFNVVAPMDYWHQTKTAYGLNYNHMPYGYAYAFRYTRDSITAIRAAGCTVPIAPIGQAFDNFGRLEMGPYAPSQSEVSGFLAGSRQSGAIGVSLFEWMSATVGEWRALHNFTF